MKAGLFRDVCDALGYDVNRVVSVRLNPRQAVLTYTDDAGELSVVSHRLPAAPCPSGAGEPGGGVARCEPEAGAAAPQ